MPQSSHVKGGGNVRGGSGGMPPQRNFERSFGHFGAFCE